MLSAEQSGPSPFIIDKILADCPEFECKYHIQNENITKMEDQLKYMNKIEWRGMFVLIEDFSDDKIWYPADRLQI